MNSCPAQWFSLSPLARKVKLTPAIGNNKQDVRREKNMRDIQFAIIQWNCQRIKQLRCSDILSSCYWNIKASNSQDHGLNRLEFYPLVSNSQCSRGLFTTSAGQINFSEIYLRTNLNSPSFQFSKSCQLPCCLRLDNITDRKNEGLCNIPRRKLQWIYSIQETEPLIPKRVQIDLKLWRQFTLVQIHSLPPQDIWKHQIILPCMFKSKLLILTRIGHMKICIWLCK
jgi:hypothetical protein